MLVLSIGTRSDSRTYEQLARLLPRGASLLDLACGDGAFLCEALRRGARRAAGVELSEEGVRQCVAAGLAVHQGDITEGLTDYPDASFDCVSLIRTVEFLAEPEPVLREMLRVGRTAMLSFINHGCLGERLRFLLRGAVPGSSRGRLRGAPARLSLAGFRRYCRGNGIRLIRLLPLRGGIFGRCLPGLFAPEIAVLLDKAPGEPPAPRGVGAGDGGMGLMRR